MSLPSTKPPASFRAETLPVSAFQRLTQRLRQSPYWRLESGLIAGAIVVGMGSAWLSEANRDATTKALLERFRVTNVLVAAKDLPSGTRLTPESVRFVETLKPRLTANSIGDDNDGVKTVLGRNLAVELKEGDPILLTTVEGTSSGSLVAAKIPPGKRLVTLTIKDKVAQKGWIKPNDRVDVIAQMELPGRGQTAFTLLEDVTLVSVGRASVWEAGQAAEGTEIGFYAAPADVEFVNFAEHHGEFSLSLRNPQDIGTKSGTTPALGADGIDMNKFLDHASISKASGGGALPVYVKGQRYDAKPSR